MAAANTWMRFWRISVVGMAAALIAAAYCGSFFWMGPPILAAWIVWVIDRRLKNSAKTLFATFGALIFVALIAVVVLKRMGSRVTSVFTPIVIDGNPHDGDPQPFPFPQSSPSPKMPEIRSEFSNDPAAPLPPLSLAPAPYAVENAQKIAKDEPGPHGGIGQSTGSIFFQKIPDLPFSFRKRVLHPGSSIGLHVQDKDEVHYVVSGTGTMTIDGNTFDVGPGDAVLTRPGHKYGLIQTGSEDLSLIITYEIKKPAAQK